MAPLRALPVATADKRTFFVAYALIFATASLVGLLLL
jgi:hypothetical protein